MYQIVRDREKRLKTTHIVLSHVRNLYKTGTHIKPKMKGASYYYTWGAWQKYFMLQLKRGTATSPSTPTLPCHYFVEKLDDDYVIYNGANRIQPSWYLQDLSDAGIIPFMYRDAILICFGEDYSVDVPEDRMMEHLCDKLLSELTYYHRMEFRDSVVLLDEILAADYEKGLKHSGLGYEIVRQDKFDMLRLDRIYTNYIRR